MEYQEEIKRAKGKQDVYQAFLGKVSAKELNIPSKVRLSLHDKHSKAVNCLACANCCKTTPALIEEGDIARVQKAAGISSREFFSNYVEIDEDGDWVFKKSPCVFLKEDNCCSIYSDRPKACSEFPHTDDKRFSKITEITLENSKICPIVIRVLEDLIDLYD